MVTDQSTRCIYCSNMFDPSRGKGDHIIPAALGEFNLDKFPVFRGVCSKCNNRHGSFEEEIIRCGPEAICMRQSGPPRRRKKLGGGWPGASGTAIPKITMPFEGVKLCTRPRLEKEVLEIEVVDQLVIEHGEGKQDCVQVYPGMTDKNLRDKVRKLNLKDVFRVFHYGAKEDAGMVERLVSELWPENEKQVFQNDPVVDGNKLLFSTEMKVTRRYFRSLVKIAFHYYLQHNDGGATGDEQEFEKARAFIHNDYGDVPVFFPKMSDIKVQFATPYGVMSTGELVGTAKGWSHILAANDVGTRVIICLLLFVGPEHVPEPHYIDLGDRPAHLSGGNVWAHELHWCAGQTEPGGVAKISPARMSF